MTFKTGSFTKAVLERYKDKTNILYIEPKEEETLGLFLLTETWIFQNCEKETPASKGPNGTLSLMYQSQRAWEDILKQVASSIIKCDKDKGNKNVIAFN